MAPPIFQTTAPKKAANLSINSDLLRQAKAEGINLSKALEERLAQLLIEKRQRDWLDENREALEAYNRRVAAQGLFSEGLRRF